MEQLTHQEIEKPILIIGLGNPILGDDGVGWVITQKVKDRLLKTENLEFDLLSLGGLSLMERLTGYTKVILIDALSTGKLSPGEVVTFPLNSMQDLSSGHSSSAHDTSLRNALDVGRSMNIDLPKNENIVVVAVEANHVYEFSRELSPQIRDAVPVAVNRVLDLLADLKLGGR